MMKRLYFIFGLMLAAVAMSNAQVIFLEDFGSGVPPTGWSIDEHASNWSQETTSNAGGTAPEAMFNWSPQFNGLSRLISPLTDLSAYTQVGFRFMHMVDHYGGPYTLGVATRSGGGDWNIVWQIVNPPASVAAEEVDISISNDDVGQPDFEICFFFSGDSYNINYWYIDDARLYIPYEHDVAVKAVLGDTYFDAGDVYIANALVKNAGLNEETFDVVLEITDGATDDLLFTDTQNINLVSGAQTTLAFASYELPYENFLYEVIITSMLDGDMDSSNDVRSKYIYTYTTERGMVLVEIGTGTWCPYCPGAAMGADDLIANGYDVAVMENHNGDDYTNVYSDARNAYYGITGYPTAVFDGVTSFVGGSATVSMYSNYLPIVESRAGIRTAFDCNLYGSMTAPGEYTVLATINKLGPAMNSNVVLHIGLTESDILENWQGQEHLNFVTRLMMPDQFGTAVDVIGNDYIEVEQSFTIESSWMVDHCELVYFLQDNDTKEILQGGKVMVNDLIPVGIEEMLADDGVLIHNIYPNPFNHNANISFSTAGTEKVTVKVYDMTGREVVLLADEIMPAGDHMITWEVGSDIPEGMYFCSISTENGRVTKKMILQR
jgi:hypothetical protein